jgi:hypothetical protein
VTDGQRQKLLAYQPYLLFGMKAIKNIAPALGDVQDAWSDS